MKENIALWGKASSVGGDQENEIKSDDHY